MTMSEREAGSRKPEAGSRKLAARTIDIAIDRAVREMLDVEQPAGLRGRVLRQVTASGSRLPAARFRLPALGFGVAAVAVLILAVLGPWPTQTPTPIGPTPPQVAAVGPRPIAPPKGPQPEALAPAPTRRRPVTESMPRTTARLATPAPDRDIAATVDPPAEPVGDELEPLRTITPIQMTPIAQQPLAPAEIAVRSLNPIIDVQIAPLTPPERRN
jgi:hypothetical protein